MRRVDAFVHRRHRLAGHAVLSQRIHMQPPVAVAHAQQMFVPTVQAQVTGTIIEMHGHVLLVRTLSRQRHHGARHLAWISACSRDV